MTVSTAVLVILYSLSSGAILHWLGMANVEYKYLSIEKSALGALPDEISKNSINISSLKTYYEEDKASGTIKLHNIKALSTLGKFYYLETKNGIRFELDASKIISRKK